MPFRAHHLLIAILGLLSTAALAQQLRQPSPPAQSSQQERLASLPQDYLAKAIEYSRYWSKELHDLGTDGLGAPSLHHEQRLRDTETFLDALQKGPPDSAPIATAATLVREAYTYMVDNLPKSKAERKAPAQPALRALLPKADGAYLESDLIKILALALLHYNQLLGTPNATEAQIRSLPDYDGFDPKAIATQGSPNPPDAIPDDEYVIYVDSKGITLDDKPIKLEQLTAKLQEIRETETRKKRTMSLTLQSDEQAPYKDVVRVLDEINKAKIPNVTFMVGKNDEEPSAPAGKASTPPSAKPASR